MQGKLKAESSTVKSKQPSPRSFYDQIRDLICVKISDTEAQGTRQQHHNLGLGLGSLEDAAITSAGGLQPIEEWGFLRLQCTSMNSIAAHLAAALAGKRPQ